MFNGELEKFSSTVDHQKASCQNPNCSDFDDLNADGLNIEVNASKSSTVGLWSTKKLNVMKKMLINFHNSWFKKNHEFSKNCITLNGIWTSAKIW